MAIARSLDNGDGSYTFTTDDGQNIVSMGPAAAAQHASLASGAPDERTASIDPSVIQGFNAQDRDQRSVLDAGGPAMSHETPPVMAPTGIDSGPAKEFLNKPMPRQGVTTLEKPTAGSASHVDPSKLNFGGGSQLPQLSRGAYVAPTKAGWVPGSKTEEQGLQETPKLKELHDAAQTGAENAAAAQASYETNAANFQAEEGARRQAILERQQAQDEKRHMAQQRQVDQSLSEYKSVADQFQSGKIDPDQWMKQQGGGGRFKLGLAAALGAIGQGLAGIPNQTADFVKSQIDNNIKAQTANRDALRSAMDAKHNQLSDIQKSGMDQDEFVTRQRALGWKAAEAELETRRKDLGIQAADVNYQKTMAAIQSEGAKEEAKYQQLVQNRVQTHSAYHQASAGGYLPGRPDDVDEKRVRTGPTGQHLYFTNDKGAEEFGSQTADVNGFVSKLDKLEALRNNPEAHIPGSKASGEYEQLKSQVTLEAPKALSGLSRFTELEKSASEKGQGLFEAPGAYKAMREAAHEKVANIASANGGIPVQPGLFVKDPRTGVLQRGYKFTGGPEAARVPTLRPYGGGE